MNHANYLLLIAASTSCFAGGTLEAPKSSDWISSLGVGPFCAHHGHSQNVVLTPDITRTYTFDHAHHAKLQGELFVGKTKSYQHNWQSQLGVAVAATDKVKLQGHVWDDADPQFDNHVYQYRVQHAHVAVKGKALLGTQRSIMPWLSGAVGLGWNRSSDFTNTPLIDAAIANPNFGNHTHHSVTYTLGAGLQHAFNDHWQAGAGYEFSDWGRSHLSPAAEQTTARGITLRHLRTHALMFNVTHTS